MGEEDRCLPEERTVTDGLTPAEESHQGADNSQDETETGRLVRGLLDLIDHFRIKQED